MAQMGFEDSKLLLKKQGIEMVDSEIAYSDSQAVKIALKLGFPVVLKIDSPDIVHKTDAGCVVVNVNSVSGVHSSYRSMIKKAEKMKAGINGVLVQKQSEGFEVIIGAKRDPQFGPVVIFGMGGIFVEVLKDVSMRIAPIDRNEAMRMIKETKAHEVLKGVRGKKPADVDSLSSLIAIVSNLMMDHSEVKELDLNPCFVNEKGFFIADARIII